MKSLNFHPEFEVLSEIEVLKQILQKKHGLTIA
jgi:hypothetical protein